MAVSFILIKIISPERCSSLVFSINYKWQVDFIVNQYVSVMKIFRKPVPVSASGFSIIKNHILLLFFIDAADKQNSHDLNTAYTCERYEEV
ncbi:conserved hypothetical protein [Trichinella spiralis]|uniref:hypothetical protein n=1 Tax=Trichinella spiralis TaxID=6334 RepID=UPI0001EFEF51|nr:conserved hypothetical protein [Trichinella spiralis]